MLLLVPFLGVFGAAAGLCYGLKILLPVSPWLQLLIGALIFLLAGLIYVRSSALSVCDRDFLRSLTPNRAARIMRRVGFFSAALPPPQAS